MTRRSLHPMSAAAWHLVSSHAAQIQALARHAAAHGRRFTALDSATRTIDACSLCGAEVEHDAPGPCCHGADIVPVEVFRPEPRHPAWTDTDEARWQAAGEAERRRIYESGVAQEQARRARHRRGQEAA